MGGLLPAPAALRRTANRLLGRSSDWGSLIADLSDRGPAREWEVHDRTHLEFALDYKVEPEESEYEWQVYIFTPKSLRVDRVSYDKSRVYADLQSYLRYAVPAVDLDQLSEAGFDQLAKEHDERQLRVFACQVRASGVGAIRTISKSLETGDRADRSLALAEAARTVAGFRRLSSRVHELLGTEVAAGRGDRPLAWAMEDICLASELMLCEVFRILERADAPKSLLDSATEGAVDAAAFRQRIGLGVVVTDKESKRDVEKFEYRRHVLKRFTSSVLWLRPVKASVGGWIIHFVYGLAAALAMAFALIAASWNGWAMDPSRIGAWVAIAVIVYAAKDRIKSWLQNFFAHYVSKRLPDRRWDVQDGDKTVAEVAESIKFVETSSLPELVIRARDPQTIPALEREARPESVIYHVKRVEIAASADVAPGFTKLTEIIRLDLRRWLAHTDNPKREIAFADPVNGKIRTAMAPRVYNLNIVFRLCSPQNPNPPFRRTRVVVNRKGIVRVEPVVT